MTEMRSCTAHCCVATTREGKPFCPDHVEKNPYVQWILGVIADMNDAEDRIDRIGINAVDPKGPLAGELLDRLGAEPHWGHASVAKLIREVQRRPGVVRKILYVLSKRGRVTLGENKRGASTVEIVGTGNGNGG